MRGVGLISPLSHPHLLLFPSSSSKLLRAHFSSPFPIPPPTLSPRNRPLLIRPCKSTPQSHEPDLASDGDDYAVGVAIGVEKLGKNHRRIGASVGIDASLQVVWRVLTDYDNLSELVPGLAESRLVERRGSFAKLFQVGEQDLAFGVKFKAKGVLDCYEKDLENLPFGYKRDIEFNMVEGDFQIFEGKWSIEQITNESHEAQEYQTTLSYVVDVKPKLWLPVRLVEGRICRDITMSLSCIREEAERVARSPQLSVSAEL